MIYDKKMMKEMGNDLERYLEIIENFVVIDGLSTEDYKNSVKTVKKLIKKLKKGKGDEVFDKKRYIEVMNSGRFEDLHYDR